MTSLLALADAPLDVSPTRSTSTRWEERREHAVRSLRADGGEWEPREGGAGGARAIASSSSPISGSTGDGHERDSADELLRLVEAVKKKERWLADTLAEVEVSLLEARRRAASVAALKRRYAALKHSHAMLQAQVLQDGARSQPLAPLRSERHSRLMASGAVPLALRVMNNVVQRLAARRLAAAVTQWQAVTWRTRLTPQLALLSLASAWRKMRTMRLSAAFHGWTAATLGSASVDAAGGDVEDARIRLLQRRVKELEDSLDEAADELLARDVAFSKLQSAHDRLLQLALDSGLPLPAEEGEEEDEDDDDDDMRGEEDAAGGMAWEYSDDDGDGDDGDDDDVDDYAAAAAAAAGGRRGRGSEGGEREASGGIGARVSRLIRQGRREYRRHAAVGLATLDRVRPLARACGDRVAEGGALCELAAALQSLGEAERAIPIYLSAVSIFQSVGEESRIVPLLGHLKAACLAIKAYDDALDYAQQQLDLTDSDEQRLKIERDLADIRFKRAAHRMRNTSPPKRMLPTADGVMHSFRLR